jgi:hypothetical protein
MRFIVAVLILALSVAVVYRPTPAQDIKTLEKQLKKDPDNPELLLGLGKLLLDSGDYMKARGLLTRAADIDSMNAKVFHLLTETYIAEASKGYSEKIHDDTEYQTMLVVHIFTNMNRAIELAPEDPELRFLRGAYVVNMPVFASFFRRLGWTMDMARGITDLMVEENYTGMIGQAMDDLRFVAASEAPEEMKAEAYYYLGMAHRMLGLQYWQTLTKDFRDSDPAKQAWEMMKPEGDFALQPAPAGERVLVRFNIAFESDIPPQTAVWVEDADGAFVKTLYVSGFSGYVKERQVVLPAWGSISGFETNNTTGASIARGRHLFACDCTNGSGARVKDGSYTIWAEVHHWPSMHYQSLSATVTIGGSAETKVVTEGDLVPFFEVRYLTE